MTTAQRVPEALEGRVLLSLRLRDAPLKQSIRHRRACAAKA